MKFVTNKIFYLCCRAKDEVKMGATHSNPTNRHSQRRRPAESETEPPANVPSQNMSASQEPQLAETNIPSTQVKRNHFDLQYTHINITIYRLLNVSVMVDDSMKYTGNTESVFTEHEFSCIESKKFCHPLWHLRS